MVDNREENLPERRPERDLVRPSQSENWKDARDLIAHLTPEDQAEVVKTYADELLRLDVKERESALDVEIVDEKAKNAIDIARNLSRVPAVGFRVESVHETKEGKTRITVGRGCASVILLLLAVVVLAMSTL